MMRSLYSGVAGLKTHQTKMDVIGNNIANVNTTAYKAQNITFNELMYQTTKRASGASAETGVGGTNANQIGLGVKVGAINTNIATQGAMQTTNLPFDIAITGDAFFIVNNGLENYFTRAGSFYIDGAGNLAMTSTGYNVMGWQPDPDNPNNIRKDTVTALRLMTEANMTYPPEATTLATVSGIVDRNDTDVTQTSGKVMNLEFYDNLGYRYTARFSVHVEDADSGMFYTKLDDILDSNGVSIGRDKLDMVTFGVPLPNGVMTDKDNLPIAGVSSSNQHIVATNHPVPITTPPTQLHTIEATVGVPFAAIATDQAAAEALYGAIIAVGDMIMINADGQLVVNPAGTNPDIYDPNKGINPYINMVTVATTTAPITTIDFAVGTPAKPISGEGSVNYYRINATGGFDLTGAPVAPAPLNPTGVADPVTLENIRDLYGNISMDGVLEFIVTSDGTLVITRRLVDNVAQLEYDAGSGSFIRAAGSTDGDVMLSFGTDPLMSNFENITVNFTTTLMSNNNGRATIGATAGGTGETRGLGAGRRIGEMIEIIVQDDGRIYANYDNGQSRLLGQIATATFANPTGLEKKGDNLYSATMNSGEFDGIGEDIKVGGGYMTSGVLEMSNVDLSSEFTEMITTQRGFQANSRIITVSDSLLEELTNLKR